MSNTNPLFERLKDRFACEDNRTIGEVMLENAARQGYGENSVLQMRRRSQVCNVPYVPTHARHGSTLVAKRSAPISVICLVIMASLLLLSLSFLGYFFGSDKGDSVIVEYTPSYATLELIEETGVQTIITEIPDSADTV